MKETNFLDWRLWILALGSFAIVCQGTPRIHSTRARSSYVDPTPSESNTSSGEEDEFMPYLGNRFTAFDWDMCKLVAKKYPGNFLISPLSMKFALVVFYEGAKEQTAHEIANVLNLSSEKYKTRNQFAVIRESLTSGSIVDESKLNVGTHVFLQRGLTPQRSYRSTLKRNYEILISRINFANRHAIASINKWVRNVTNENIAKIIDDEDSVENAIMLVVNAMYFKGSWRKNLFRIENTRTDKFYKTPDSTIDVPFMSTSGNFHYAESLEYDAKILRIPYSGGKFSMNFVLPNSRDGLDGLLEIINSFSITRHMLGLEEVALAIKIPKFKMEFTIHMKSILHEMGIKDLFDNPSFFDDIALVGNDTVSPLVSDVIQKAGIEVNEKGSTGFASTGVMVINKMGETQFVADHPFIFYIEDEVTATILYMGRITDPAVTTGSTKTENVPTLNKGLNDNVPRASVRLPSAKVSATSNTERHNYFNTELFQALNKATGTGNVLVSPLSVQTALTALVEGSGGKTRSQLLTVLRLPEDIARIRNTARNAFPPLQDANSGTEISVATRLWAANKNRISFDYQNALQTYYNSDVASVDFTDSPNSANVINEWVRGATKNHIRNFVEPGSIAADTILLLTSAIYFKGRWLKAFDESATTVRCFQVPDVGCQQVPMMENVSKYNYAYIPSLDTDVAEIPYSDGRLSMLVFLPRREGVENLWVLSKDLSYTSISIILGSLRETKLLVAIPRFSIHNKLDLRPVLEDMGIKDLFSINANLTGILPEAIARVGNVLHDAKIEVNEVGTIAAAATGLSIVPLMGNTFESFRVDRPFLFAIVDRTTSTMPFAGRVVQP